MIMARIKNEKQYQVILKRVESLMEIVTEETQPTDPNYVELDLLADLAEEYEIEHYPVLPIAKKKRYHNMDADLIPA